MAFAGFGGFVHGDDEIFFGFIAKVEKGFERADDDEIMFFIIGIFYNDTAAASGRVEGQRIKLLPMADFGLDIFGDVVRESPVERMEGMIFDFCVFHGCDGETLEHEFVVGGNFGDG